MNANKQLTIAAALCLLGTGCGFESTSPTVGKHGNLRIRKVTIDGHIYYTFTQGGILHSESCTNSTHMQAIILRQAAGTNAANTSNPSTQ